MNLKDCFKLIDEKKLVMPDFQRDYVWKTTGQSSLAASILLNLPIGSFLLLSGSKDDFATKELGFAKRDGEPKDECKFLLDGQQRLTSLRATFSNVFSGDDWQNTAREIYSTLKVRWYMRIKPLEGEEDIFGWERLHFDASKLKFIEPSQMENRLVNKTIGITKSSCWWNPDYAPEDSHKNKIKEYKSNKCKNLIAKKMAEENALIPLYAIYDKNDNTLLEYVLDHIAEERRLELKSQIRDNYENAIDIFQIIDPEISIEDIDDKSIDKNLNKLAEKWKQAIMYYLIKLLEETETQVIDLPADEISRAVVIFERINKGGTRLDNFDLVVARAARDKTQESLNKRIIRNLEEIIKIPESITAGLIKSKPVEFNFTDIGAINSNEIDGLIKKQYLNLLSIFSYTTYGNVEDIKLEIIKKDKILNISHKNINNLTNKVITAIKRAFTFLHIRCGIIKLNELHYNLMLLPIAYLLSDDEVWESKSKIDKIEYWYWGSILSGEYRMYPNEKSIKDIQELYGWVKLGEKSDRYDKFLSLVLNIDEFSNKDLLIRERIDIEIPSVIHKTLLQYELSRQPSDLLFNITLNSWEIAKQKNVKVCLNKKEYDIELKVEDHHIIPLATQTTILESTKGIRENKKHILNSILNRTYILSKTNSIFSNKEPIKYLENVKQISDINVLNGHFITDDYKNKLNLDQLDDDKKIKEFLKLRFELIKNTIQSELNSLYNSID